MTDDDRPASNDNNLWYHATDSDTVFVFVHGLLSDSRDAWFYKNEDDPTKSTYWPRLIRDDPKFDGASIFLGGFYTEIDAGSFSSRDGADELFRTLSISVDPADYAVLDKPNILFITHSTGGIVVRHMLTRHIDDFKEKNVGLVLIASPSKGARDANRFGIVADIARQKLGKELRWNNPFLEELDNDFKNLVNDRKIPRLQGAEWLEHHLLGGKTAKWFGLARNEVLVEKESGAQYFGAPTTLAGTDHVTAVKPDDRRHPAYTNLRYFYEHKFRPR